jgi:hypothetical protein
MPKLAVSVEAELTFASRQIVGRAVSQPQLGHILLWSGSSVQALSQTPMMLPWRGGGCNNGSSVSRTPQRPAVSSCMLPRTAANWPDCEFHISGPDRPGRGTAGPCVRCRLADSDPATGTAATPSTDIPAVLRLRAILPDPERCYEITVAEFGIRKVG